jgi:glycosyltransferase involved in cell wall biosynthesis
MPFKAVPLVSVIIPTYNRAALLPEALDSVYAQEGAGDIFATEVIVVDDASTDATPEVVRRYPGVRYLRLETNRGVAAARNAGLRASTGQYVAWLDDDDLWLPHRLQAHVPVLEAHPAIGVLYGQYLIGGEGAGNLWPEAHQAPSGEVFRAFLLEHFIQLNTCLAPRAVFQRAGDFDETLRTEEDYDICLRLAWHVPFTFMPGAVAIQRVSTQGSWFTHLRQDRYEHTLLYVVEKALALLPNTADYAGVRREAYATVFSRLAHGLAKTRDVERMRAHVLTALQRDPWLATEPWVWTFLTPAVSQVACTLALTSDAPITAVREFCAAVRAATAGRGLQAWVRMQRLLAHVWEEVSAALGRTGASQARRPTGHATLYAVLHNPTKLRRKMIWQHCARTIFVGPRSTRRQ